MHKNFMFQEFCLWLAVCEHYRLTVLGGGGGIILLTV